MNAYTSTTKQHSQNTQLPPAELKRLADFFALLITIDRRLDAAKKTSPTRAKEINGIN